MNTESLIIIILFCLIIYRQYQTDDVKPLYYNLDLKGICADVCKSDASYNGASGNQSNGQSNGQLNGQLDDPSNEKMPHKSDVKTFKLSPESLNSIADSNNVYDNFADTTDFTGDDLLARRSIIGGKKCQQSILNRCKWNKNSFKPYVEQEIEEHANSRWWDNDDLENEF